MAVCNFFEQQLFNNQHLADVIVIVTTQSEEECTADPPIPSTATSATRQSLLEILQALQGTHQTEEIYANICILSASSEFFQACTSCRWQSHCESKAGAQEGHQGAIRADTESGLLRIVVSVLPEEMAAAREMIRFMYTQRLPADVGNCLGNSDLLALYRLADRYIVPNLQVACLQHMQREPLHKWTANEQQQLFSMAGKFFADADIHAGTALGAAAAGVAGTLVACLQQQLEVFWQQTANRMVFMSLPHEAVLRVLRCDALAVRSEDTVLVVALSWLRGEVGGAATLQQRREVLEAVRLLRLSPWFLHFLLSTAEAKDLLARKSLLHLTLHIHRHTSSEARAELEEAHLPVRQWASRREGRRPDPVEVTVSWRKADVLSAVNDVRAGRKGASRVGEQVFVSGVDVNPIMYVVSGPDEQRCALACAGLQAAVWVGGANAKLSTGVSDLRVSFKGKWGASMTAVPCHKRGAVMFRVSDSANAEQEVGRWCTGDVLEFLAQV